MPAEGRREALGTVAQAVYGGSRVEALRALAVKVATTLDRCESARDVSALSNRVEAILEQIAELEQQQAPTPAVTGAQAEPTARSTPLDELSGRRRAEGRPDAASSTRAGRRAQRS